MQAPAAPPQERMKDPAVVIAEAMQPIQAPYGAASKGGVPSATLALIHVRASQINGCSSCVQSGSRSAKKARETDERLFAVAAWRHSPHFTGAERAALALAEAVTRLSDRADPVPDEIWDEAARHYDHKGRAALLLMIAVTNVFKRLNVATRQVAGAWGNAWNHAAQAGNRFWSPAAPGRSELILSGSLASVAIKCAC
jgi:AhpD family alkylhydroperoxidase